MQRKTSRSKLAHGLSESHGSTGQYGRTFVSVYAVSAMAAANRIWHAARTSRGCCTRRIRKEPAPLPAHNPNRKTARRSEEHTSELQSRGHLVCRLLLEKKKERAGN